KRREIADSYLGSTINNAVPAYFNISRRQATKDASPAWMSCIHLRPPSLPTVSTRQSPVYVASSFDVSFLTVEKDIFEVKATACGTHLAPEELGSQLVSNSSARIRKVYLSSNLCPLHRLRTACERAKRTLAQTFIEIHSLSGVLLGLLTSSRSSPWCILPYPPYRQATSTSSTARSPTRASSLSPEVPPYRPPSSSPRMCPPQHLH
ncbi:hypothetical protein B0H13DRAFT_1618016, partial [Mycena leptocephala]